MLTFTDPPALAGDFAAPDCPAQQLAVGEGHLPDAVVLGDVRYHFGNDRQQPPKTLADAQALAQQFVDTTMAAQASISEPLPHKPRFAFFRLHGLGQDWFAKIWFGTSPAHVWLEPQWMAWAAAQGLSPAVHPAAGEGDFASMLVSAWVPGRHLNMVSANRPHVRKAVLQRLRQLHGLQPPVALAGEAPAMLPDAADGAWGRLHALELADQQSPLPTQRLRTWVNAASDELRRQPQAPVICHRDTHPRNMFLVDGQVLFIDWDYAGWDDPLRDVAKFFVLANTPWASIVSDFGWYTGQIPTHQQLRSLFLHMLVAHIDFYGANLADYPASHPVVMRRAERIQQLAAWLRLR